MSRIVRCKTWWDSHDWNYRAAESVQRKPSEGRRDSRDSTHRARRIRSAEAIERGKILPS